MNAKKYIQAVSKHRHIEYAAVPGHLKRETVSVVHLVPQTAGATPGAPTPEEGDQYSLKLVVETEPVVHL